MNTLQDYLPPQGIRDLTDTEVLDIVGDITNQDELTEPHKFMLIKECLELHYKFNNRKEWE